jgi:hypothetical protein
MRTLAFVLTVLAVSLGAPRLAAAAESCEQQQKTLAGWLDLAAADRDAGAIFGAPDLKLVALPLAKSNLPGPACS